MVSDRDARRFPAGASRRPGSALIAAVGALAVLAVAGAGHAMRLELRFPANTLVDKGTLSDPGDYFESVSEFQIERGSIPGNPVILTVKDFFMQETSEVVGELFVFTVEDPGNPGSYVPMRDLELTWDQTAGSVVSETYRTKMTFLSGMNSLTSYYDLTLSTSDSGDIFCPASAPTNFHLSITGHEMPPGPIGVSPQDLTLTAAACAVEEMGLDNDLPGHILLMEMNATLVPALSPPGLAVMAGALLLVAWPRLRRPS